MAFSYTRTLTVDHTKCGSVDSANFTVLVSINHTTLKLVANGGHVTDSGADDVAFTSDSLGATPLNWEIEFYDGVNGILCAWVKLANVSVSVDTVFYMFYGDATITTPQNTPTSAWHTSYKGVWHLGDGTTLNVNDSTISGMNMTNVSTVTAGVGQVDGAGVFNGSSNFLRRTASSSVSGAPLTISAWIKGSSLLSGSILTVSNLSSTDEWFRLAINTSKIYADQNSSGGASYHSITGGTTLSTSTWYFLGVVFTGGTVVVYLNGVSDGTGTYSIPATLNKLMIGAITLVATETEFFNGTIDEVNLADVARTASWMLTQYNNQFAPGNIGSAGFLTFGSETSLLSSTLAGASVIQIGLGLTVKGARGF